MVSLKMKNFKNKFLPLIALALYIFAIDVSDAMAAGRKHPEAWYVEKYCSGEIEHSNVDKTRTDCLVDGYSIEFDFADKWYECLTQAGHYSILNKNEAICFLIAEGPNDTIYTNRAQNIIDNWNLPITIVIVDENGMQSIEPEVTPLLK